MQRSADGFDRMKVRPMEQNGNGMRPMIRKSISKEDGPVKGVRMAMALLMAAMLCIGAMAEGIDDQVIGVFGESNVLIKDEKWGIVTPDGEIIVPFEYDWMGTLDPENGLAYVEKDGKHGVLDLYTGETLFEVKYDSFGEFYRSEAGELAVVQLDGKYGYMKRDGEWLYEPQFEEAGNFIIDDGYAIIQTGGKFGLMHVNGEWLIDPIYEDIHTSGECQVSMMETWYYTQAALHAVNGDNHACFDVENGKIIPRDESPYDVP